MRIWRDAQGSLITDEQLARYIATFGSLSRALEAGDVQLVAATDEPANSSDGKDRQQSGRRRVHAPLATFL